MYKYSEIVGVDTYINPENNKCYRADVGIRPYYVVTSKTLYFYICRVQPLGCTVQTVRRTNRRTLHKCYNALQIDLLYKMFVY